MYGNSIVSRLNVMVFVALALPGLTCAAIRGTSFECFAVSDLVRVFEDGYGCPRPRTAIEIFGIRNEIVSAQCVIKANEALERVTVTVSSLVNDEHSVSMPESAVEWNFVGSILISENTPKHKETDLIRPAPARFPDYLAEERESSLEQDGYKAVFLTVRIPRNATAGRYKGTVTVNSNRGSRSLPLRLRVYPLTLPDERHLMVTKWYTTSKFKQFHGIDSGDPEKFY